MTIFLSVLSFADEIFRLTAEVFVIWFLSFLLIAGCFLYFLWKCNLFTQILSRYAPTQITIVSACVTLACVFYANQSGYVPRYALQVILPAAIVIVGCIYRSKRATVLLCSTCILLTGFNVLNRNGDYYLSFASLPRGAHDGDYIERDGLWVIHRENYLEAARYLESLNPNEYLLCVIPPLVSHPFALPEMGYTRQVWSGFGSLCETEMIPQFRDLAEIPDKEIDRKLLILAVYDEGWRGKLQLVKSFGPLKLFLCADLEEARRYLMHQRQLTRRERLEYAASRLFEDSPETCVSCLLCINREDPLVTQEALILLIKAEEKRRVNPVEARRMVADAIKECPALRRHVKEIIPELLD